LMNPPPGHADPKRNSAESQNTGVYSNEGLVVSDSVWREVRNKSATTRFSFWMDGKCQACQPRMDQQANYNLNNRNYRWVTQKGVGAHRVVIALFVLMTIQNWGALMHAINGNMDRGGSRGRGRGRGRNNNLDRNNTNNNRNDGIPRLDHRFTGFARFDPDINVHALEQRLIDVGLLDVHLQPMGEQRQLYMRTPVPVLDVDRRWCATCGNILGSQINNHTHVGGPCPNARSNFDQTVMTPLRRHRYPGPRTDLDDPLTMQEVSALLHQRRHPCHVHNMVVMYATQLRQIAQRDLVPATMNNNYNNNNNNAHNNQNNNNVNHNNNNNNNNVNHNNNNNNFVNNVHNRPSPIANPTINCAICLDPMLVGQLLNTLTCRHAFHEVCINTWEDRSNECPVCRASITPGRVVAPLPEQDMDVTPEQRSEEAFPSPTFTPYQGPPRSVAEWRDIAERERINNAPPPIPVYNAYQGGVPSGIARTNAETTGRAVVALRELEAHFANTDNGEPDEVIFVREEPALPPFAITVENHLIVMRRERVEPPTHPAAGDAIMLIEQDELSDGENDYPLLLADLPIQQGVPVTGRALQALRRVEERPPIAPPAVVPVGVAGPSGDPLVFAPLHIGPPPLIPTGGPPPPGPPVVAPVVPPLPAGPPPAPAVPPVPIGGAVIINIAPAPVPQPAPEWPWVNTSLRMLYPTLIFHDTKLCAFYLLYTVVISVLTAFLNGIKNHVVLGVDWVAIILWILWSAWAGVILMVLLKWMILHWQAPIDPWDPADGLDPTHISEFYRRSMAWTFTENTRATVSHQIHLNWQQLQVDVGSDNSVFPAAPGFPAVPRNPQGYLLWLRYDRCRSKYHHAVLAGLCAPSAAQIAGLASADWWAWLYTARPNRYGS